MIRIPSLPACVALGLLAGVAPAAAQTMPSTPGWDAPAGAAPADGAGATKAGQGKAARGKAAKQRSAQREAAPPPVGGPMRRIDRNEIDMSGTGSEREGPSSFRPMIRNGGVGFGTAF